MSTPDLRRDASGDVRAGAPFFQQVAVWKHDYEARSVLVGLADDGRAYVFTGAERGHRAFAADWIPIADYFAAWVPDVPVSRSTKRSSR